MKKSNLQSPKPVTICDIAKYTNTSVATVSRVLSNSNYPVSKTTRELILSAAKELNYTPNLIGRMLKTSLAQTIGVIVPSLQNPFFNQALIGIEAAALEAGLGVQIFNSHRDVELERACIEKLIQMRIMKMLIFSIDHSSETIDRYTGIGGNVAILESNSEVKNVIKAQMNFVEAGQIAATHLIEMGHRKIAFITSPMFRTSRVNIYRGCKDIFDRHDISFSEKDIFTTDYERDLPDNMYEFQYGKQLASEMVLSGEKYTAVVVINDIMAYGVMQQLHEMGVNVPQDISIISFDNLFFSSMITPALTTVEQPATRMGQTVCQMLIEKSLSNQSPCDITIEFSPKLVTRQSVCQSKTEQQTYQMYQTC